MVSVLAAVAAAGTVVVGVLSDPVTLDPHKATDLVAAAIVANVCEPLVRYEGDGARPEPALATSWATVDGRRWTFTLRPGVRFQDGTPFDADAVVANVESLARERAFAARAERLGDLVVAIVVDRPNAALLATLSQPFFALQSPRELARPGPRRPVGTGAFRLASVRAGLITLEAFAGYRGGRPRVGAVVFRRLASEVDLAEALLSGDVDVTAALTHDSVSRLVEHRDVVVQGRTGLNIAFLSLNNERAPLSDRRVRQAIARAIDRPGLVASLFAGHAEPARNPLPPAVWGYGERTRELVQDLPQARRLLREAGFARGFEATLLVADAPRPYNPSPLRLAAAVAEDLSEVGIRTRVERVPTWAQYLERAGRGDYEMAVLGWQADTTDPNDFLSALLASELVGATNRSRYRSPTMDLLLKQGRRSSDHRQRSATYRDAQALFQKDMPWIPLYHVSTFTAYRRAVTGLQVGPTGIARFDRVWKKP